MALQTRSSSFRVGQGCSGPAHHRVQWGLALEGFHGQKGLRVGKHELQQSPDSCLLGEVATKVSATLRLSAPVAIHSTFTYLELCPLVSSGRPYLHMHINSKVKEKILMTNLTKKFFVQHEYN